MIIDTLYIVTIICLFIYTGIQSTYRELQTNQQNSSLYIDLSDINDSTDINEFTKLFSSQQYLHSIWIYTDTIKKIIIDNKGLDIPPDISKEKTEWLRKCFETKFDTISWQPSFQYQYNKHIYTLIPYCKRINKGCVACMFSIYI